MPETHDAPDQSDEHPSKSQVKRDMHALLELGRRLIDLPVSKLTQLGLDEKLLDAIELAKRTRSHEGLRRQTHYVGKLMRQADAQSVRRQLDLWENGTREQARAMHRLEALRDKLIEEDATLPAVLDTFPDLDIQALRSQIRAARKDTDRENYSEGQSE